MDTKTKRKTDMEGKETPKRVKKECNYGETCFRRNPAHFREYSHPHLESIIDSKVDSDYVIPSHLQMQRHMIIEQIEVILESKLYEPKKTIVNSSTTETTDTIDKSREAKRTIDKTKPDSMEPSSSKKKMEENSDKEKKDSLKFEEKETRSSPSVGNNSKPKDSDYRPIVPPTRRPEAYLKVVRPSGKMAAKHDASAPYHIFYTTISDAKETHGQPYSITFLEILDRSLGELKCSLQINFMVEISWLMAQYYFAGYSEKKLTILYEDDCGMDLRNISKKKPQVDAHFVTMATPFGKHHTKMMLLCYEDGSMRVVISTANLYADDWENRTQGLWFSPKCPELPIEAMPHDGESPTMFKRSILKYLDTYHMPQLAYYIDRVKRCDFSHINVFLVASVPGSHFNMDWGMTRVGSILRQHSCIPLKDVFLVASVPGSHFNMDWGMTRVGSILRQHCCIPQKEQRLWPLITQASSLGSYGKDPKLWLTGDFLHNFTKIKDQSQLLSQPPELKMIYPSLENVRQSHDGLLGGGCLPYAAEVHTKQPWLNNFLHQWLATRTNRNRAMPHIKSYTRINASATSAAFYLLTSANISKAAWGQLNKGNGALRIMSYEAGVLFLPKFVINADFFPLQGPNRLIIPYDLPPTKYTENMSPWVSDYLCR